MLCLFSLNDSVFIMYLNPPGEKEDGYISQIPGLSPSVISCPEERARGKRVTVQKSDSDYVKLSKQGGHKGGAILLAYNVYHQKSLTCALCGPCQQGCCGMKMKKQPPLPIQIHTNLQTGSVPHQKTPSSKSDLLSAQ